MTDLFGHSDENLPKRRGHAAQPGTGPEGETCKTCWLHYRSVSYHDKTYRKCRLMEHCWSHCDATDIRAKDPACRYWNVAFTKEQEQEISNKAEKREAGLREALESLAHGRGKSVDYALAREALAAEPEER